MVEMQRILSIEMTQLKACRFFFSSENMYLNCIDRAIYCFFFFILLENISSRLRYMFRCSVFDPEILLSNRFSLVLHKVMKNLSKHKHLTV